MTEPAVIRAVFSEWQMVKTRSTLKLIFEVPLEQQGEVLSMLGVPMPGRETWCAIARLQEGKEVVPYSSEQSVPQERTEHKTQPRSLTEGGAKATSRAQMAGICCNDPAFWAFLNERYGPYSDGPVESEKHAAEVVRGMCMVESRQLLDVDHEGGLAWDQMLSSYRAWQRAPQCGVPSSGGTGPY